MSTPRCVLGGIIQDNPDLEEVKRAGWQEHGILVIAADDARLGCIEKQVVQTIGERLYGDKQRQR